MTVCSNKTLYRRSTPLAATQPNSPRKRGAREKAVFALIQCWQNLPWVTILRRLEECKGAELLHQIVWAEGLAIGAAPELCLVRDA